MQTHNEEFLYCREGENAVINCGKYSMVKHGDGDWIESANLTMAQHEYLFYESTNKNEMLELTKQSWDREYRTCINNGKIVSLHEAFYIGNPAFFDRDIDMLKKFKGNLSLADQAWIKNTKELIKRYYALYEKEITNENYFRNLSGNQGFTDQ
jgi:hypothetical protein